MDRKGTQMFLSLLRSAEVVSKCQATNRRVLTEPKTMLGRLFHYVSTDNCISRTTTWREINKIPKCFSCPGNCKELSKKTKRSTYDSNQARTKPWPTRLPTSDSNSLMRIKTIQTSNKNLFYDILDVGMEKEQTQELGWRVSVLPNSCIPLYTVYLQHIIIISHSGGMQEWVIQIPSIPILVLFFFHPYI